MENNEENKLQSDKEKSGDSVLNESLFANNEVNPEKVEASDLPSDDIDLKTEKEQHVIIENVEYDINQDELINIVDSIQNTEENIINIQSLELEEIRIEEKNIDYSALSKRELIDLLIKLIEGDDILTIKNEVEDIKNHFYKKHKVDVTAQKRLYYEKHGNLDNFEQEEDKEENEFKLIYKKFKELKTESNDLAEREKERNLKAKNQIIEDIQNLVHKQESISKIFHEFRELQQKWRDIGIVPQSSIKELWHNYNLQVEKFYEFVKIDKELRDLDLKKNLEAKMALCEKAEELLLEPILKKAVNELQKLHSKWTEIGPVPREKKDEVWDRFRQTSIKINKRYQDYVDKLKIELEANLTAKIHITEKAEELANLEISSRNEWEQKTKEIIDLQKMWRTIGAVPKRDSNLVFERFRSACDKFFNNKKEYFYRLHEDEINNLQIKTDICIQAETLKDSTDWKKTTIDLIQLQNKWKQVGPVPQNKSEEIWNRFRESCNEFFNNKAKYFASLDTMLEENIKIKLELIEKVEKFENSENIEDDLNKLKQYQKEWTETGNVPAKNKTELQNNFRKAIDLQFDKLNLDEPKRDLLKYRLKIESLIQQPNSFEKLKQEKDFLKDKIKALEADISLLDNNMGFFAKSKNSESLLSELNKKIENGKKELKLLKDKYRLLDKYKK